MNLKQLLAEGKISEDDYKREMLNEEEFYQRRLADLYEFGSKERADADQKILEKKLDEDLKKNKEYQDELERIRKDVFGPTQEENDTAFGKAMESLDKIHGEELKKVGDNDAEKDRINNQYNEKKAEYETKYNQKSAEGATKSYQETILQSADWLQNSDGGQALTGSVDFLAQASQAIFSQMSSIVQAEQDIQLAAVNNKYDQEIAAAEGNNYKIKQLEKQKSEEEAKIKKEGSKKMFAMQVIQAIATTAQAALNAYASTVQIPLVGTVLAPIAAGVAVVTGMLQVAAIKKQQQAAEAQGYFTGGFTRTGSNDYTPAGVVHANEWVANAHLLRSPIARPMIEALDYAQRTNTIGSLNSDRLASSGIVSPQVVIPAQPDAALAQSIATNTAVLGEYASVMSKLNDRLDKPFVTVNTVTGDHGIQKAQSEYDNMIKNKTPKSRWK